jgi:hypothetical protein
MSLRKLLRAAWLGLVLVGSGRTAVCSAAELRFDGVLGNSGVAGESLVRVAPYDRMLNRGLATAALSSVNARRGNAGGVAVDRDLTLLASGGDRIHRLSLAGHRVESFPLEPAGSRVDARTFVVADDVLYFFGRLPKNEPALFALPLSTTTPLPAAARSSSSGGRPTATPSTAGSSSAPAGPARSAVPLAGATLPVAGRSGITLVDRPLAGGLGLVYEPSDSPGKTVVDVLDPATGGLRRFAELACDRPMGATLTDDGRLFVGARFPELLGKSAVGHQTVAGLTCLSPEGSVLPGFPISSTFNGASAVQYRGDISFADGALWELGWYGYISRLDRYGKAAPGNVRIGGPKHDIDYPSQFAAVAPGLTAVTSAVYDSLHLVRTGQAEQIQAARRIGCLPEVRSLGLSPQGWVFVGTPRGVRWWRWDDAPDAPCRRSEAQQALTQGTFGGDRFFTLAISGGLKRPIPSVFQPALDPELGFFNRKLVPLDDQLVPFARPVGLSAAPYSDQPTVALAVDAETKKLWRTRFDWRSFRTPERNWTSIEVNPPLESPTDVTALADGRILVADGGTIRLLVPDGGGYRNEWALESYRDAGDRFGSRLRMAVSGTRLWVSDAERHRVLVYDWVERKPLTQHGRTDEPGTDIDELAAPEQIAVSGDRAVIFDSGNQRVVKLRHVETP